MVFPLCSRFCLCELTSHNVGFPRMFTHFLDCCWASTDFPREIMASWDPPRTRSVASGEQSCADLHRKTRGTGRRAEEDRGSAERSRRPVSGKRDQEVTQEGGDARRNAAVRFCCATCPSRSVLFPRRRGRRAPRTKT